MPLDPRWSAVPSAAPDVSATPQARVLSWEAHEIIGAARTTAGCFGFELGGYTDELAQVLLDRIEPFAVRAAGGALGHVTRSAWVAHGFERREALEFQATDGRAVTGTLAFGFENGALQACFAVCSGAPECAALVSSAAFATPREPLPAPSFGQSLALGALAHPRPVALGFVVMIALVIVSLLFTRGARASLR